MRQLKLLLVPEHHGFHPADAALAKHPSVTRERIHYINVLDEDTMVTLYEVTGDVDRALRILQERSDVLTVDVAGDEDGILYIHLETVDPSRSLVKIVDQKQIVLEYPLRYTDRGLVLTLGGTENVLRETAMEFSSLVKTELIQWGDYRQELDGIARHLTDRQAELFKIALEMGYFDVPRNATHEDIGERVGVTSSTVAEILQRVESKILTQFETVLSKRHHTKAYQKA